MNEPVHDFEGKERRKLGNSEAQMVKLFMDEIRELEQRMDQKLDGLQDSLSNQYSQLVRSIETYTNHMETMVSEMRAAFVQKNGKPDYLGHATDHEKRMASSAEMDELLNYVRQQKEEKETADADAKDDKRWIKRVVIGAILAPFSLWVCTVVWSAAVNSAKPPIEVKK